MTDEPLNPAEVLMGVMEGVSALLESVVGYRAECERKGFSPTAAEIMAVELHAALIRGLRA